MAHRIIIGNQSEYGAAEKPDVLVTIDYEPPHGLTLAQEVEMFKQKMRVYRKALGLGDDDGHEH